MPKNKKLPLDPNQLAASIVAQATDLTLNLQQDSPEEIAAAIRKARADGKDPLAVLLGRRGGLKGGTARSRSLSAKKRKNIAKKAALCRWRKKTG